MDFISIVVIAIALGVDAFAVALGAGVTLPMVGFRHFFRLSWHFGLFQAMMNVIGWSAGLSIKKIIEDFDHWVAFGLLAIVGGRMIHEALSAKEGEGRTDPTRGKELVMLSVATSIDSLAVGLSFSLLNLSIWLPALVIGLIASIMTAAGLQLGRFAGTARLGVRVEVAGGIVLIVIGLRILHEHGVFNAFLFH